MFTQSDADVAAALLDRFSERELLELVLKGNLDNTHDDASDPPAPSFQRRGEVWKAEFDGRTIWIKHRVGLKYIQQLLRAPGQTVPVSVLQRNGNGHPAPANGDAQQETLDAFATLNPDNPTQQPSADRAALAACAHRLKQINDELERAANNGHDPETVRQLEHERTQITDYLHSCTGNNGRIRPVPDNLERIRKAVTNAITRAIDAIDAEHHKLGTHLRNAVKTGYNARYTPADDIEWRT